jgi:pilus assembly protein Flp/PilA
MKTLAKFAKDESGATAIEYGLIAALIGIVIIVSVAQVGLNVKETFDAVATGLQK